MPDASLSAAPQRTCRKCSTLFSGKECKGCRAARKAAWKIANPDLYKAQRRAEYLAEKARAVPKTAEEISRRRAAQQQHQANYRAKYPERVAEAKRKYEEANEAAIKLAASKAHMLRYAKDPESIKAKNKRWAAENLEAGRTRSHNRRARVRAAGGRLSRDIVAKLKVLQKGRCACCGEPLGDEYDIDHIMPIALGGSNTDDNVQLLLRVCNLQKHKKHPVDFMQSRGFLI